MRQRKTVTRRRIVVGDVEYHWCARGDDGYIAIVLWPTSSGGPRVRGSLRYHETLIDFGDGVRGSAGDQIVVTNRLIRRIIEHAITEHDYNPNAKGSELNLRAIDHRIRWDDAVRASRVNRFSKG